MKEKIEQLSRGIMTYELPRIKLSEEKLSFAVEAGSELTGSIAISNEADVHMKGLVYSTNPKLTVSQSQFVGSESVVEYTVHAEYSTVNDHITGELCFITNCGEITLPFNITVAEPALKTIIGSVHNMYQFAALARENWTEARRLFTTDEFEDFLSYYEPQHLFLWERLLKSPSVDNAMEEFLVATRKKMGVTVEASKKELRYDVGTSSFSDGFRIRKNNWGYINLSVTSDVNFLEPEQEIIRYEDFAGSEFELKYIIYPERMKPGYNTGNLVISGCGIQLVIPVSCHLPGRDKETAQASGAYNRLVIKSVENYIAYAMNRIPAGRYVSEAMSVIDRYESYPDHDPVLAKLYRANLLKISGKESPAASLLNSIDEDAYNDAGVYAKALYLYLNAERVTTTKPEYLEKLYSLCNSYPEELLIQLFVLKTDERYLKNPKLRLDELRTLYEKGCRSPLMYIEAARIYNMDPRFVKELGEFETATVMYSLKTGYCNRDLAGQFTELVLRAKTYVKLYYNALALIYERFQPKDALIAICQTLIRGYKKDSRYFKWYQKGVEENIRISDLYEYYMYSMDTDVEENLDQSVLMYYVYNSKLNDRRLAYLYANIVLHKDSNPIVYENYKEKLRIFAIQQMRAGKNDKMLSILYNDSLCDPNYEKQFSEHLSKVLFRCEVRCNNPLMRCVCVSHKELEDEVIVPLINGEAQVDLFTDDARVFMLDASNNRYILSDEVTIENLMASDDLSITAYRCDRENEKLIFNMAEKAHKLRKYDQASIELRKQAVAISGISERGREVYLSELVFYFYDHAQDELSEEDLKRLDYRLLSPAKRGKFIGLLILREQYTHAFKLMEECGFGEVDIKLLEKFAVSLPPAVLNNYNKTLCDIMYHLFLNGRRNEKVLIYLVNYYNGLTSCMYDVWQEACAVQCATSDFDERILGQILFTESYLPYGEQIYAHYHRRAKNRALTKAYFNYLSYKYLVSDVPISQVSMELLKRDAYYEGNDMVVLACLKQLAMAGELTAEEQEFARNWLEIMDSKGKILPCFTNFAKYFRLPENMEDKIYIEYRTNPDHRVMIHIATRQDGKRVVREESMRNVCYGIFVKEIVLFAQETIEYVISDDDGIEMTSTERTILTGPVDSSSKSKSRFASINAIIMARNAKDKSKSIELLNDYVKKEFAISQLFHEIE
ncbi:MAG: DUF5717 family protein [Lachnospiraceae bacterium]